MTAAGVLKSSFLQIQEAARWMIQLFFDLK